MVRRMTGRNLPGGNGNGGSIVIGGGGGSAFSSGGEEIVARGGNGGAWYHKKTVLYVLIAVFGPREGQRLTALPLSDPEVQRALAEAALAGEVVGDDAPPLFSTRVGGGGGGAAV